jgi:hypothetical protein
MMDNESPVTRAEFHQEMTSLRQEMTSFRQEIRSDMAAQEDRLMAGMREIETNLLTAFHGYVKATTAHFHELDVGEHDLRLRILSLEDRVLALETRRPQQN